MFNAFAKVLVAKDLTEQIKQSLKELGNKQVYVGIPEKNSSRESLKGDSSINNAELLYIQSHGIREREMINEMSKDMNKGAPYSKAYELYVHSQGSPLFQTPPRPVLEPAIENDKEEIASYLKKAAQYTLDGDTENAKKELEAAGLEGQNAARDWFANPKNGWDPNSPSTIKRKGSDKPLIDTGEMRKAITYVVKEGD